MNKKNIKDKLGAPGLPKKDKNPFLNPDGGINLIDRFPSYERKGQKK